MPESEYKQLLIERKSFRDRSLWQPIALSLAVQYLAELKMSEQEIVAQLEAGRILQTPYFYYRRSGR